jgi:cell division protein FtsB
MVGGDTRSKMAKTDPLSTTLSAIEELKSSNEELKVSNAELKAGNAELKTGARELMKGLARSKLNLQRLN